MQQTPSLHTVKLLRGHVGYALDTSNKILCILTKALMLAYTRDLLLKCHKYCELIEISQADNERQETIMYRRNISSSVTVLVHGAMHRQETFTSEDDAI